MATYKKRGYKPKNKAEEKEFDVQDSTTAEVFSTLDESASKTEAWVSKNQNYILGAIILVAVGILGYLGYNEFIQKPKEQSAFLMRAYKTRVYDPAFLSKHKEYQFCIPREYDRKVVASGIAKSMDISQLVDTPLKEILLETLIADYPCSQ